MIVTHRDGGSDGSDTVANVGRLNFTGAEVDMSARRVIARMYDAMYDREPDQAGLAYWAGVNASGVSFEQIAAGFVGSPESQALLGTQTDAQFIDTLYQHSLERAADASGRAFWVGQLEQGRVDRAGVLAAFANSDEKLALDKANGLTLDFNRTDVASLVRMYDTLFDRSFDTGGLNFWIGASESGMGLDDIADAFVLSDEAVTMFGGMTNTEFVAYLYRTGLEREGSAGEVSAWAALLDSGAVSRGDALLGFADSEEKIALTGVMSTSFEMA